MKTSPDQIGSFCVKNDKPKIGCGQSCGDDEYCSLADGTGVTENFYYPTTSEQVYWSTDVESEAVTAVCPFNANIDNLFPSLYTAQLSNSIQRYNTPFCTCRKRLTPMSTCQLTHNYRSNLDIIFLPESSHHLIEGANAEYKLKHRNVEHIDIGCPRDQICVAAPENGFKNNWGKCANHGENIAKTVKLPLDQNVIGFEVYDPKKHDWNKKIPSFTEIDYPKNSIAVFQEYRFDLKGNDNMKPNYKI
jgi:hypothetical protein